MNAEKLFRAIHRINSLILLALGIAGLFVVGALLKDVLGGVLIPGREPPVLRVAGTELDDAKFFFGNFSQLPNLDVIRAPLRLHSKYRPGFSSGGYSVTKNFLFIDLRSGHAGWLSEDHSSLFPWDEVVTTSGDKRDDERVLGILYHVIAADTTGDGLVTSDDRGSIALSDPTGGNFTSLVHGVDRVLASQLRSDAHTFIFYIASGSLRVVEIDFSSMTLVGDRDLSAMPALDQSLADGS